jgi:hypothetical protein
VLRSVAVERHRFLLRDALCGDVPSAVRATRRKEQGRWVSQPCLRDPVARFVLRRLGDEEWSRWTCYLRGELGAGGARCHRNRGNDES